MSAPPDHLALDIRDVAKRYRGRIDALRGIELHVGRGEIFGLLGPNGAGKSTLVKILMTITRPTRAQGTMLGQPIGHKATLGRLGYLPENHRIPKHLTGRQAVEFFGALSNVDRATCRRRTAELLELVGMKADADRLIGTYSKGMAQRIGLAQALVNDPEMVLLDEPTDGVDPLGRRNIRDVLLRLREQKKTVFINSHLLSELEMISDRVAILVAGCVARQGTIAGLTEHRRHYEIDVETNGKAIAPLHEILKVAVAPATPGIEATLAGAMPGAIPAGPMPPAPSTLPALPPMVPLVPGGRPLPAPPLRGLWAGRISVEFAGPTLRLYTTDAGELQPIVDRLRTAGLTILRMQLMRPSLEDLFIEAIAQNGGRP